MSENHEIYLNEENESLEIDATMPWTAEVIIEPDQYLSSFEEQNDEKFKRINDQLSNASKQTKDDAIQKVQSTKSNEARA